MGPCRSNMWCPVLSQASAWTVVCGPLLAFKLFFIIYLILFLFWRCCLPCCCSGFLVAARRGCSCCGARVLRLWQLVTHLLQGLWGLPDPGSDLYTCAGRQVPNPGNPVLPFWTRRTQPFTGLLWPFSLLGELLEVGFLPSWVNWPLPMPFHGRHSVSAE